MGAAEIEEAPREVLDERINVALTHSMRLRLQRAAALRHTQESTIVRQGIADIVERIEKGQVPA